MKIQTRNMKLFALLTTLLCLLLNSNTGNAQQKDTLVSGDFRNIRAKEFIAELEKKQDLPFTTTQQASIPSK